MPALQVLDLSGTAISSLLPSIGCLANLRVLCLNFCRNLKVVPSEIGGLGKLESFQLLGSTEVCHLPLEIGDLVSLKQFLVEFGPSVEEEGKKEEKGEGDELQVVNIFPRLSKLSRLESLHIYVHREAMKWWGKYCSEDVSLEISKLNKLTRLSFTFSKIEHLEHFVGESPSWKQLNLTTFQLVLSPERSVNVPTHDGLVTGKSKVVIYNDGTKKTLPDEILTQVDYLVVSDNVALQRLSEFGLEKMNQLNTCIALGCKYMETIILNDDDNGKQNSDLLPRLQLLDLHLLPRLKSIWEGPLPSPPPHGRRCFPSLTILHIGHCPMLKRAFSRGLISHLANLVCLSVRVCSEVEEIIGMDEEGGGEMVPIELLPRLETLDLDRLPKLTSICSNKKLSSGGWQSLEKIGIWNCDNLKSLPRGFAKAPNLQKIGCQAGWWEALEWEDNAFKQQLSAKVTIIQP